MNQEINNEGNNGVPNTQPLENNTEVNNEIVKENVAPEVTSSLETPISEPVTEVATPAVEAPATEEVKTPAVEAPATEVATPAGEATATEEVKTPAVEAPATEEVKTPAVEAPATEEVKTPVVETSATEEPTPAVEAPVTGEVNVMEETTKKSNKMLPIVAIILVVIVLAIVALFVSGVFTKDNSSSNNAGENIADNINNNENEDNKVDVKVISKEFYKNLKNSINTTFNETTSYTSSYEFNGKYYSVSIDSNSNLIVKLPDNTSKTIATNVVSFYNINTGNGGYKTLYFVYNDGTVGKANIESSDFDSNKWEVATTDLKDIVYIAEGASTDGEGGSLIPLYVDINGNILTDNAATLDLTKGFYETLTKDINYKINETTLYTSSYEFNGKYYSISIDSNSNLIVKLPDNTSKTIATNIVNFYNINTGNGGYKTLYFVYNDGTVGKVNIESSDFDSNKWEVTEKITGLKDIVYIIEGTTTDGESGGWITLYVDLNGNIVK